MTAPAVLVTGGAGYIGSHVCACLAEAGFLPVTFDDLSRGYEWAVKWGPLETGDIREPAALVRTMRTWSPIAVIHLAGLCYVHESFERRQDYHRANVEGTASVLEAMRECAVGRLIFSSSCTVYGVPEVLPIVEGHPLAPISPYGETKLAAERLIAEAGRNWGLDWVFLRYFNAAGADPAGRIGESHWPETHIIPNIIRAGRGLGEGLTIYGDDFPTPDGSVIRDFVHVSDIADAHHRALAYLAGGGTSRPFNIGTGKGVSIKELIGEVGAALGCEIPYRVASARQGDPAEMVAEATDAGAVLGWAPRHSDLATILRTAIAWRSPPLPGGAP